MPNTYKFSDIFISYSRKDGDFVKQVTSELTAQGYDVWVDWRDIPQTADWWAEIKAGIEAADIFAFVISPDSVNSDICFQEINHAVANNKRIIPILYRSISNEQTHPVIHSHNWVLYDETQLSVWVESLIQVFKMDMNHLRHHTRYLVRAKEWEDHNHDDSYLLQGTDAHEAEFWLKGAESGEPRPLELHERYIRESIEHARFEEELRQRNEALRILERRTAPAFGLSGIGAAYYILSTYPTEQISVVSHIVIAIAVGILFGMCLAAVALYADELIAIRYPGNRRQRLVASSLYGFIFASAAWSVIQLIYFGTVYLPAIWLGGAGVSLGFVLNAAFKLEAWQALTITFIGSYIPIAVTHNIPVQPGQPGALPLLLFTEPGQLYWVGLPMACLIALGGHGHSGIQKLFR